eukprot:TRINITY_DN262_c2_g1_i1.p1 TRINITY_DN262_c2_g1~~TRINITY_DN262_c2_g1_i1.p1  ORF type:complete len:884 (-),score=258.89 TRINITY_DN262_c2_g1_i1:1253-3835(-)
MLGQMKQDDHHENENGTPPVPHDKDEAARAEPAVPPVFNDARTTCKQLADILRGTEDEFRKERRATEARLAKERDKCRALGEQLKRTEKDLERQHISREQLDHELKAAGARASGFESRLKEAETRCAALEVKCRALAQERDRLRAELERADKTLKQEQAESDTQRQRLKEAESQIASHMADLQVLALKSDAQGAELVQFRTLLATSNSQLEHAVASLQRRNEDMEQQSHQLTEAIADREALRARVDAGAVKLCAKEEALKSRSEEVLALQQSLTEGRQLAAALQKRLDDAGVDLVTAAAESEAQKAKISFAATELAVLQKSHDALTADITGACQQRDAAIAEARSLSEQRDAAASEAGSWKRKSEMDTDALSSLREALEASKAQVASLMERLDTATREQVSLKGKAESCERRTEQCAAQIASQQQEMELKNSEAAFLRDELALRSAEVTSLKQAVLQERDAAATELANVKTAECHEREALLADLAQAGTERDSAAAKVTALEEQLDVAIEDKAEQLRNLNEEITQSRGEAHTLLQRLAALTEEKEVLSKERDVVASELGRSRADCSAATAAVKFLTGEVKSLEEEKTAASGERNKAKELAEEKAVEVRTLTAQLCALATEKDELCRERDFAVGEARTTKDQLAAAAVQRDAALGEAFTASKAGEEFRRARDELAKAAAAAVEECDSLRHECSVLRAKADASPGEPPVEDGGFFEDPIDSEEDPGIVDNQASADDTLGQSLKEGDSPAPAQSPSRKRPSAGATPGNLTPSPSKRRRSSTTAHLISPYAASHPHSLRSTPHVCDEIGCKGASEEPPKYRPPFVSPGESAEGGCYSEKVLGAKKKLSLEPHTPLCTRRHKHAK